MFALYGTLYKVYKKYCNKLIFKFLLGLEKKLCRKVYLNRLDYLRMLVKSIPGGPLLKNDMIMHSFK